jgi:catalase (peroxidase I)
VPAVASALRLMAVCMCAGLVDALNLLKDIADSHRGVSYADLFQMASGVAIQLAGGPHIPLRYGRKDVDVPEGCAPEGRLPGRNKENKNLSSFVLLKNSSH